MDIPTVPGAWYTVASTTTCQITDTATGTPLGTADAGSYTFQAQGNLTTLSDDSALYSKSNFKSAPAALMALGLLGGGASTGSALPAGYLAAEFLESRGGEYVETGVVASSETGMLCEARPLSDAGWMAMGIRNTLSTDTRLFPPRWRKANLSAVGFGWGAFVDRVNGEPLDIPAEYAAMWQNQKINYRNNLKFEIAPPIASGFSGFSGDLEPLPFTPANIPITLFTFNTTEGIPSNYLPPIQMKRAEITKGENLVFCATPAIDARGVPCMYDKVSKQPFYNYGTGAFIVGMTCKQALKLANLPATGGTLTISLPTGYDSDSGVMSALETARANGWTLTIQTYTPEAEASAATFALRRIWVRRTADENGAYVAADGTRWQVDWCVDMLTPDGSTPDAHGYELFRSQNAAVAYWELSPYVDPESENLLTE